LTTIAKETIKLPDILKDSYKRLEDVLNKKTNSRGLHLLTGDSEIEKFYYAKIWAKQYEKELIYLDVEKLLLSPDKLDEAEMYISKKKPCLVYFKNLINLLHNYKNPENSRAQKIMSLIEKFQNDSRITMLGTISLDAMDIRDDLPTIQKIISEDLSEIIISKINFGELTAKQKQKIYSYFELKLKDDREVAIDGLEEFFDATEKMTNLTFTCYILEYMSLSLLAMGKLITHELYTNLLKRKETENKLINHA
jgi:hypothetical protein